MHTERTPIYIRAHHLPNFEWAFKNGASAEAAHILEGTLNAQGADTHYFVDVLGEKGEHSGVFKQLIRGAFERAINADGETPIIVSADHKDDLCAAARYGKHCDEMPIEYDLEYLNGFARACLQKAVRTRRIDAHNLELSAEGFKRVILSPNPFISTPPCSEKE
jgi:hypothetical protein